MFGKLLITLIFFVGLSILLTFGAFPFVEHEGGKTYIVDRTGERWDVTQAESIGFKPDLFQFGIGRNAFTTLDESNLSDDSSSVSQYHRVIGMADGSEEQAYSVPKLRYHEIANSKIGSKPIAVGYWPLVDLAAVYSRQIDEQTLTLVPSGWTYRSTFVLYDRETETLWYPYEKGLMGIQGKYFKRWLPKLESEDTRWGDWVKAHPNSLILK